MFYINILFVFDFEVHLAPTSTEPPEGVFRFDGKKHIFSYKISADFL